MLPTSCLCVGSSGGSSSILADYDPKGGEQLLLDEATDLPVCNYDENPTPLYKAMEAHQWGAAARFLKTGVWPGHFFGDAQTPKEQAKTWVHRYDDTKHELRDDDGHDIKIEGSAVFHKSAAERARLNALRRKNLRVLRWKQLPLHAALIFMAPPSITKQIIELFPYALRCADDKGMLPLHLAFRQAVPDDILTILLKLFPNAMHVKDKKGRLPVECVRMDMLSTNDALSNTGPSALRGMIVQSIMQQSKEKFSQQQQHTVERFQNDITGLQTKLQQLELHLQRVGEREEQTRHELHTTLEELNALKKNHKKWQEIQKYAMEKQTVQEQQNEFQRRIMEQLSTTVHQGRERGGGGEGRRYHDDEEDSRDDYHQHSRRRRGRSRHRHTMEPPPSRTPSMPPTLPQQDQDSQYSNSEDRSMALTHHTQRVQSQSSYYSQTDNNAYGVRKQSPSLDQFLNKYHDPDDAYMTEDNSYAPSSYSEFTKSILPNNPTGYTTAKSSVAPSMMMQREDTMTWNNTRRSVLDGKKNRSSSNALMGGDQTLPLHPHQSVLPPPPSSRRSMGNNASKPVRRPTPVDTAVASQSLMALNPNGNNGSEEQQKQANRACSPQSLNWDLSGFLRPLGNSS